MDLQSDDDIWRYRLRYLGPPGWTLPIQLPYAQLGLGALLVAGLGVLGWMVTGTPATLGLTTAVALFLTAYIWRYVDADRPPRKILKTFLIDWRSAGEPKAEPTRLSGSHIRITEMGETDR
jgi:hypothetical protein